MGAIVKLVQKMVKKTNFLLFSLIAALAVSPAYSVTVSKTYVDKQDKGLQSNILLLRDMLNTKDSDGKWLTLDTEAKLAIPAINELYAAQTALEAAIADKQEKGDYALAADLTALDDAIKALESGMVSSETIADIQTAIDNLGETYASKTDMNAADQALLEMINAINIPSLEGYVKSSELAKVAKTGQYADLEGKPEIPSIVGLATSEELTNLQTALEAAIAEKQAKGDYLVAADLNDLNAAVGALQSGKADASTVTTIQETINKLGDTYAAKSDLTAAEERLQSAITNIDLTPYAKTADLAKVATTGQYADLEGKPEIPSIAGLATNAELSNLQTTLEAAIAEKQAKGDYLVAADLKDLNDAVSALQSGKADASTVTTIQETINKLGDTYAAKSDLTAAEERLQSAITNIDLTPYAKTADVNAALANKVETSDYNAHLVSQKAIDDKQTEDISKNAESISKNTAAIAILNGDANTVGSVKNEIKVLSDLLGGTAGDVSGLTTQVGANTTAIEKLNAEAATIGSVANSIAEALKPYSTTEQVDAKDAAVLQAAKDYADENDADTIYDDTALAARVSANETAISSNTENIGKNADAIAANETAIEALQGAGYVVGAKAAGSYLVNFDAQGNASYAAVEILDEMGAPIDLTTGAVK